MIPKVVAAEIEKIEDIKQRRARRGMVIVDPEKAPAASSYFKFTTLDDLLAEPKEEIAYAWDRTLPRGGFSIVCAKPKVGKSTLARGLAVAISRGEPFLGRATQQGKVLYLCLEEKRTEVSEHFRRMGAVGGQILIFTGKAPGDVVAATMEAVEEHSPAIVIIDPLSRFVRIADFNSYAEVTRQLEPLVDIGRLSTCQTHVMALHHNGKGGDLREGGDAVMGSTGFFAAVDTLLTMRKREKVRTIESTQRYGEDLIETIVHLDPLSGILQSVGDMNAFTMNERKKAVLDVMGNDPLTEGAIKEMVVGSNGGLTSKAVRALFEENKLERSGGGKKGDPFLYRLPSSFTEEIYFPPGASDEEIDAIAAQERYA
ncbi:MAG: AAA family ATPase [Acidobacteriota bacterium]